MNNLVIFPMLIPVIAGLIMIVFRHQIKFQKVLSIVSVLAIAGVTGVLIQQVNVEGIQTIYLGGWEPPFGIVFVGDMFALILVLTSAIVAIACLFYAFSSIGKSVKPFTFMHLYNFYLQVSLDHS